MNLEATTPIDGILQKILTQIDKDTKTTEDLFKFFRDNREVIDTIEVRDPEEHAKIMKAFASKKEELAAG